MQITLLSVYKMDEATKKPTTDAAAIEKFTVKLKKLAARQVDLQTPSQCMASDTPLCKVSQAQMLCHLPSRHQLLTCAGRDLCELQA
jgi:hypothetical protein